MSQQQVYTIADVVKATGRPIPTVQQAMQRANVGHLCGKYRLFTEFEYSEIIRIDKLAKEQKAQFGPLLMGYFGTRGEVQFPFKTTEQVAVENGISTGKINQWLLTGKVKPTRAGMTTLFDQDAQDTIKRLSDEAKAKTNAHHKPFSMSPSCTPGFAHIAIDPSMLKFSITREGAKKLIEYLTQQIGEA